LRERQAGVFKTLVETGTDCGINQSITQKIPAKQPSKIFRDTGTHKKISFKYTKIFIYVITSDNTLIK